jgi:peroxiredoxin family protein
MRLMGIDERELVEGLEFGGVASFLGAARSRMTLFI